MIGQNVFSRNHNANLGDAIISSGSATPQPASTAPAAPAFAAEPSAPVPKAKTPLNKKLFLTIGISVLATILVLVLIYFLFLAPKKETGETVEVYYASPDNDGSQTTEETLNEFDKEISAAGSAEDKLNVSLGKIGYYIILEDYESALSALSAIDVDSLSDYDQYRVYNYYASAYNGQGDTAQASRYTKLANEANARDMGDNGE